VLPWPDCHSFISIDKEQIMRLKRGVIGLIAVVLLGITCVVVMAGNDIDEYRSCKHCGMDRKAYGYSRMMVIHENGSRVGVCSLNCAVTEMNGPRESAVTSLLVADRDSHTLIDAEKAVWVVGGNKRGVMTQNPKWAFARKESAQSFVDAHGGTITSWEAALSAARDEAALRGKDRMK
jgi:nitrous oxide reductase accessory protein NosL